MKTACRDRNTHLRIVQGHHPDAEIQCLQRNVGPSTESYRIMVEPNRIQVLAASPVGWFYGLHTLADLLENARGSLATGRISDSPALQRRGIYLDCSRGKVPTLDTLFDLIRQLGAWKINELQLYVENVFTFRAHPTISRGFSPFTPEDMLALQDECRRNFIRFVPSLTSFGHFERILSLPKYSALGEKPGNWGYPGGTTLCPTDRRAIRLVSDMYEEFLPLFDSVDFNACCDETWELGKGRSQNAAERKGLERVYLDFILKLHKLCDRHGKRMNIWGDIVLNHPKILPDVPRDIVMLNWDYSPDGSRMHLTPKLTRAGLNWLACPGSGAWGSHGSRHHHSFPNISNFARIAKQQSAEGLLMTDWGDFGHRNTLGVSLPSYAWAAAHAWGSPCDAADFLNRFCQQQFGARATPAQQFLSTVGTSEVHTDAYRLYYSFHDSLTGRTNPKRGIPPRSPVYLYPNAHKNYIETTSPDSLERVIANLEALPSLPTATGLSRFAQNTLDDLRLAVHMDLTACRRMQLSQALRNHQPVPAGQKQTITADLQDMADTFEANWLRRNRPSRLQDNLRLIQNCMNEIRSL